MVLGERQPRWPECHIPSWIKGLSISERQQKLLQYIEQVVKRYRDNSQIIAWQVENEPLLDSFAICGEHDKDFLKKEVELVISLSSKKIILTDSGELGFWITTMQLSDIFGTTLYRDVYNPYFGYVTIPYLPYFYNIKSHLVRNFFAQNNKRTVVIELQAEPWSATNNLIQTPIDRQTTIFPLDRFKQNIEYAKKTGFDEDLLWGVEWWYWMEKQGYPQYLDYAKTLFNKE